MNVDFERLEAKAQASSSTGRGLRQDGQGSDDLQGHLTAVSTQLFEHLVQQQATAATRVEVLEGTSNLTQVLHRNAR